MRVKDGVLLDVSNNDIINGKFKFPDGVTSIGRSAFYACTSLLEINIPDNVTNIGDDAFRSCCSLKDVYIPESVITIGDNAFNACISLGEVYIPDSVTRIGNDVFWNCEGLLKIHMPKGITSIGEHMCCSCTSLLEVDIPEGVTDIGHCAFYDCTNMTKIHIPKGVKNIGNNAFCGCINLSEVYIPDSVTIIEDYAFANCNGLAKIRISEAVTSIDYKSFYNCNSLRQIQYGERILKLSNSVKSISANKYGLIVLENEKIEAMLKNQKELIKLGFIESNLSQKQKDEQEKTVKGKLEAIYNNINLKISKQYKKENEIYYLNKMINVAGVNGTEILLKIPNGVSNEDIQNYGEKLLDVYEPKYKLKGNVPLIILMLENIDTVISKESKNVRSDRNKFYTKFNELLDRKNDLNIEELLQICAKEIGLDSRKMQIQKIKREMQTMQLTEKTNEIKSKIVEKLNNPENDIEQTGVSSTLIFNVIKRNILSGGNKEDIEEIFENEINRITRDGTRYYGASIQSQKDKLKKAIEELYTENSELLNTNIVDILRDTKHKIGDRWILRLKNSKNNIRDLQSMTEEEKNTLIKKLEKNEINVATNFSKKYELKPNISSEKAIEVLSQEQFPEILTYEKAEMMFPRMKETVSEKFGEWFVENKSEIMGNPECYSSIATLHNEFDYMMQDPIIYATFENKNLTPKLAFDILKFNEKEGRIGNEELLKLVKNVIMTKAEVQTAQDIFEVTKKREKSYIPTVKTDGNKYRGRILRADDPMNILAGNVTNCCQKIGGLGEGTMLHASIEDTGRIFMVEEIDEKGRVVKPVAQSWVWRNKDTICFDNIEISAGEKPKLKEDNGDIKAQQEILEIYKECAKNIVNQDEKMLGRLLKNGKITQEMYNQLVVKTVTVGIGHNDLGILKTSELEEVPAEKIVLPKEKERKYREYNGRRPWIDSGIDSATGKGEQLYLVKEDEKENKCKDTKQYDLEDLPVKPMYHNEREVRKLKGRTIDKGVVNALRQI